MSMNLISTNRAATNQGDRAATDWAALTAISATDAASPYPTEGYVAVSPQAIVALAALLDDATLANGQTVTTYDFSCDHDGRAHVEAHVNAFGPSLLDAEQLLAVRAILAPFPIAIAMLEEVIVRDLQVTLSTDLLNGTQSPYLKPVNWPADEVEINRSGGNMVAMLRDLGLTVPGHEAGETDFETFAKAVNDNGDNTDYPAERLRAFVACGRRQRATHVYWA